MNPVNLSRVLIVGVPLAAALIFGWQLARAYPALPPRFAVHFGLSGEPNGWMGPRLFALVASLVLAVVLGSIVSLAITAPPALLSHPLPPTSSLVITFGTGVAVGAFLQILHLALQHPPHERLGWTHILLWPVALVILQTLFQALVVRF